MMMIQRCIHAQACHIATIGKAKDWHSNLLQPVSRHSSRRTVLRSASNEQVEQLSIPRTRLRFDERAFSVSAPRACNSLPVDIRYAPATPLPSTEDGIINCSITTSLDLSFAISANQPLVSTISSHCDEMVETRSWIPPQ